MEKIPLNFDTYWVIFQVLSSPGFWLVTFTVILAALMPYIIIEVLKTHWQHCNNYVKDKNVYKLDSCYVNNAFIS